MTAAELIAKLQRVPADIEVVGTWEGTLNTIGRVTVAITDDRPIVLLDVDGGGYERDGSDRLLTRILREDPL